MQSCCIVGCESYKNTTNRKICYFKFPTDDELFAKWVTVIKEPRNWTPKVNTQICETHFRPEDIERPLNKYPYLKSDAVPSIFPKTKNTFSRIPIIRKPIKQPQQQNQINSTTKLPIAERLPNLDDSLNEDSKMSSPVLQSTPLVVASRIVDNFPKIYETLMPSNPQRFRKILPKTAQHTDTNVDSLNRHKENRTNPLAGTNPYIIIIPTFNNNKSLVPCSMRKVSQKNTRRPILKITVSRKIRQNEKLPVRNEDRTDVTKSLFIRNADEFVVNNYKLNKSVIFSFDPISADIRVTHRRISDDTDNTSREQTDNKYSQRITRSTKKDNETNPDSTLQVSNNFLKTQQYNNEANNELLMLRKCPNVIEKIEIEKLEKELLEYGNSVNNKTGLMEQ